MPATAVAIPPACVHHERIVDNIGTCIHCGRVREYVFAPEMEVITLVDGHPPTPPPAPPAAQPAPRPVTQHKVDREMLLRLGPHGYSQLHGLPLRGIGQLSRCYRRWGGTDATIGVPGSTWREQLARRRAAAILSAAPRTLPPTLIHTPIDLRDKILHALRASALIQSLCIDILEGCRPAQPPEEETPT